MSLNAVFPQLPDNRDMTLRHLEGKRVSTHDDTGDGHDILAEVDEWDLRDFHRETTRVQNRHQALHSLMIKPFDNQTVSLPGLSGISDTSENQPEWFDSDNQINISKVDVLMCPCFLGSGFKPFFFLTSSCTVNWFMNG